MHPVPDAPRLHPPEDSGVYAATIMKRLLSTPSDLADLQVRLHWILRVTAALCFIGHGAWGVITKAGWLPFFDVVGIPEAWAWRLMPIVGLFDIGMGIALLVLGPRRAILAWMTFWTLWTAALRPLAGMGMWEFWERAGNYVPPALLLLLGGAFAWRNRDEWLRSYDEPALTARTVEVLHWSLRVGLALLLIGHGGFGVFQRKAMLVDHWAALGLPADLGFLVGIGLFEFALAVIVLIRPNITMLLYVLAWKLLTEALYPLSGGLLDSFEFIERAGDYGVPVAMLQIAMWRRSQGLAEAPKLPQILPAGVGRELAWILGGAIFVSFAVAGLDLDMRIAQAVYSPDGHGFGTLANQGGEWSFYVALLLVPLLAVPAFRSRHPLATRVAAVYVIACLIGVLGLVHNLKQKTNRPRPVQVSQFEGKYDAQPPFGSDERCRNCVSFPSSAAGFGFLLATPFFVLRRKKPRLAWASLAGGLLWGGFLGYGRMVSGKHWFTDILWSAVLVLAVGCVLSYVSVRWRDDAG